MKRYLFVEDQAFRKGNIEQAVARINGPEITRPTKLAVDYEQLVRRIIDDDGQHYPLERLATYDAFFVDFSLNSEQVVSNHPTFAMSIDGVKVNVPVTTGMGVLLYLSDRMNTETYRSARAAYLRNNPATSHGSARVFSFVNVLDVQSQLYATAAKSWFGADYFRAISSNDVLVKQLSDLDKWRAGREAMKVTNARDAFDRLMDCKLKDSQFEWADLSESYDWLRFYLKSAGNIGSLERFRDVVKHELGATVPWHNATRSYSPKLNPIYVEMTALLEYYREGSTSKKPNKWPGSIGMSDYPDRLFDVLQGSSLFWKAPDVRWALKVHRQQQGMRVSRP